MHGLLKNLNARLVIESEQYYNSDGWIGGEIPMPPEFLDGNGNIKSVAEQLRVVIGPQYDYPKGSYVGADKRPAPGWADLNPFKILSRQEINKEKELIASKGGRLTHESLRELARIYKITTGLHKLIGKEANQAARTFQNSDPDDLFATGMMAVMHALRSRLDQAKPGNSFITFIMNHIKKGTQQGLGGGLAHRAARGALSNIMSNSLRKVTDIVNGISPEYREYTANSPEMSDGNPYGEFTPRIYSIASRALDILQQMQNDRQNPELRRAIDEIHDEAQELTEKVADSEQSILAGKTNMKRGFSIPHSGDDTYQQFVKNVSVGGTHTTGADGGEVERSELSKGKIRTGAERYDKNSAPELPDLNDESLNVSESYRRSLEFALEQSLNLEEEGKSGFKLTPGMIRGIHDALGVTVTEIPTMSVKEVRMVIRKLGLKEYPTKGTENDIEFDKKKFVQLSTDYIGSGMPRSEAVKRAREQSMSKWVQLKCPQMASVSERGVSADTPSISDLAPTNDPGIEAPLAKYKDSTKKTVTVDDQVKAIDDAIRKYGMWNWLYNKYETESVDKIDKRIMLESFYKLRSCIARMPSSYIGLDNLSQLILMYG